MPIDSSIYGQFAPRVRSPEDVQNGLQQAAGGALALQAGRMNLAERQNALADAPALRAQALAEHAAKLDKLRAETVQATAHAGSFDADAALKKLHATREGAAYLAQRVPGLKTDEDIANWYKEAVQRGVVSPEQAMTEINKVPPAGPAREAWKAQQAQMGMSVVEQMTKALEQSKQQEQVRQFGVTSAETQRNHRVNEGIAGGHLAISRAAEGRAAAAPKGQIVQTDQGPMLVDPRDPASAKPITADGVPIKAPGPKMKDIPAQTVSGYINNQTALKKIDDAIAAVKSNGGAVGVKNYAPDAIIQRTDPEGVKTRAIISDIGSLKIHDRTGAAMSAAESVRLNPFIPKATDSQETIVRKLEQMRAEYADKNSGMESYYNSDMGFKPITDIAVPRTPAAGPSGLPPDIEAILKKHGK